MTSELYLLMKISLLAFLSFLALPVTAAGSCLDDPRLTGVNLAGAEFNSNKLPGTHEKDYTYPTENELEYIARQGANIIRLPFRWERIQHQPLEPLDEDELKRLKQTVNTANQKGLCVILDLHNYAKYFNQPLQDNSDLQNAFVDLWLRLATEFPNPNNTAFGLMNEPNALSNTQWATLATQTLKKLRHANAKNFVFMGGGHWSGLHDWFSEREGDSSNAIIFADIKDPLKRTILEVHQYADPRYSGTETACLPAEKFNEKFEKITAWAKEHKQQLFLGEFGVPPTTECLLVLERFLVLMNDSVWKGWSYWAAGGWWGSYPLALNTNAEIASPQWKLLKKYFAPTHINRSQPLPPEPTIIPKKRN